MEALCLWLIQHVAKMPRDHKVTLGDRLVETSLLVTEKLVEATYARERHALLADASRGLTRCRLLVRLAHRLALLSERQSLYFSEESTDIGRMLGGWARADRRSHQSPAAAEAP